MSVLIDSIKVFFAVRIPEWINPEVSSILATDYSFLSFSLLHTVQSVHLLLRQLLLILATLEAQEVLRVLVVVYNELG